MMMFQTGKCANLLRQIRVTPQKLYKDPEMRLYFLHRNISIRLSQMFSQIALLALASVASAAYSNGTKTEYGTTVVTITSCEENKCSETAVSTGLQIVYDVSTLYTTYCPLTTSESSTVPAANTTSASIETGAANKLAAGAAAIAGVAGVFLL